MNQEIPECCFSGLQVGEHILPSSESCREILNGTAWRMHGITVGDTNTSATEGRRFTAKVGRDVLCSSDGTPRWFSEQDGLFYRMPSGILAG